MLRRKLEAYGSAGPRERFIRWSTGVVPIGTTFARSVMLTWY
jgi:hypothetical protein